MAAAPASVMDHEAASGMEAAYYEKWNKNVQGVTDGCEAALLAMNCPAKENFCRILANVISALCY